MCKTPVTIVAAVAILCLACLASERAQAGNGAPGTPSKYNNQAFSSGHMTFVGGITEFSSSSVRAIRHKPKR